MKFPTNVLTGAVMIAIGMIGMASSVAAEDYSALAKRAVELKVVQPEKAAKEGGKEEVKPQVTWKYQMTVAKTQTSSYASAELATLTAYVNAAAGTDIAKATMQKDQKNGDYLLEVVLDLPPSPSTGMLVAPDIQGLLSIEWVSNCPTNSHFVAKCAPGTKLDEKQKLQIMEIARFMAAVNHGIAAKTEAEFATNRCSGSFRRSRQDRNPSHRRSDIADVRPHGERLKWGAVGEDGWKRPSPRAFHRHPAGNPVVTTMGYLALSERARYEEIGFESPSLLRLRNRGTLHQQVRTKRRRVRKGSAIFFCYGIRRGGGIYCVYARTPRAISFPHPRDRGYRHHRVFHIQAVHLRAHTGGGVRGDIPEAARGDTPRGRG
jgi:hypothetical protein